MKVSGGRPFLACQVLAFMLLAGCGGAHDHKAATAPPMDPPSPWPVMGLWSTPDPREYLFQPPEDTQDPTSSCFVRYKVAVQTHHGVTTLTANSENEAVGDEPGIVCALNAINVFQPIHLPWPIRGHKVIDGATGKRVKVIGQIDPATLGDRLLPER
jgi:hypothetical protein